MSNVTRIGDHPKGRGKCDICGRPDHGTLQFVKDQDDQFIISRVRCINCINEWGEHDDVTSTTVSKCQAQADVVTFGRLLHLYSSMVRHRDGSGDPETARLTDMLGAIVRRLEDGRDSTDG